MFQVTEARPKYFWTNYMWQSYRVLSSTILDLYNASDGDSSLKSLRQLTGDQAAIKSITRIWSTPQQRGPTRPVRRTNQLAGLRVSLRIPPVRLSDCRELYASLFHRGHSLLLLLLKSDGYQMPYGCFRECDLGLNRYGMIVRFAATKRRGTMKWHKAAYGIWEANKWQLRSYTEHVYLRKFSQRATQKVTQRS